MINQNLLDMEYLQVEQGFKLKEQDVPQNGFTNRIIWEPGSTVFTNFDYKDINYTTKYKT